MNLRFPGQYYNSETDSHYNYFRDYNPATGRYQQRDPIGLMGGMNLRIYSRGNSILYTDPHGLLFFIPALIGGGSIGGEMTIGGVSVGSALVGGTVLAGVLLLPGDTSKSAAANHGREAAQALQNARDMKEAAGGGQEIQIITMSNVMTT